MHRNLAAVRVRLQNVKGRTEKLHPARAAIKVAVEQVLLKNADIVLLKNELVALVGNTLGLLYFLVARNIEDNACYIGLTPFVIGQGALVVEPDQIAVFGPGAVLHINGLALFQLPGNGQQNLVAVFLVNGVGKSIFVNALELFPAVAQQIQIIPAEKQKRAVHSADLLNSAGNIGDNGAVFLLLAAYLAVGTALAVHEIEQQQNGDDRYTQHQRAGDGILLVDALIQNALRQNGNQLPVVLRQRHAAHIKGIAGAFEMQHPVAAAAHVLEEILYLGDRMRRLRLPEAPDQVVQIPSLRQSAEKHMALAVENQV